MTHFLFKKANNNNNNNNKGNTGDNGTWGRLSRYLMSICKDALLLNLTSFFFLRFNFIYFWLHWVFAAARGLSLAAASGDRSLLRCAGFLLRWLLLLRSTGSRCVGFSSCGTWAQ